MRFNLPLNSAIKSHLSLSPNGNYTGIFALTNIARATASPIFPNLFVFVKITPLYDDCEWAMRESNPLESR